MRRLLQAMAGGRHGGAEAFFVRLAAALQRDGEDQRVLIRRDAERAAALREAGVATREIGFGGPLDLASRLAFRRQIADYRPDVVLTWMSRATALCPRGDFVHVARLGGYYDLKYYRRCDRLIGNTQAIVDWAAAQGWPADRAHYLPNFVADPTVSGAKPVARAAFGTPETMTLALALGRLHPNKGFDILLRAVARVPSVHLWIAGEGPERQALTALVAALGIGDRVRLLGWRSDAGALLAAADLLVCPSRIEPLGNVVIEAWAASRAVLAAAADGPAALIVPGENGRLVPSLAAAQEDPGPLAEALALLAEDPALRARLAAAGRRAYEARFTEAAVVTAYRGFLDGIAA